MSTEQEDRKALVEALRDDSFVGSGYELGTGERAILVDDAIDAVFAAGFSRHPKPVSFELGGTLTTVNNLPIRME